MSRKHYLVGAAVSVALFLWASRAKAETVPASYTEYGDAMGDEEIPDVGATISETTSFDDNYGYDDEAVIDYYENNETSDGDFYVADPDQMLSAFLYMIRRAEHAPHDVASSADYQTFFGGSKFNNMSNHPVLTGEKRGVALSADQCRAAGYSSGICVSTAAGAYQIIVPTWKRIRAIEPELIDFSDASQDQAAVRILDEIGALDMIRAGNIEKAIEIASKQWASLPGSKAKQNPKSLQTVLAYYNEGFA